MYNAIWDGSELLFLGRGREGSGIGSADPLLRRGEYELARFSGGAPEAWLRENRDRFEGEIPLPRSTEVP